VHGIRNVLYPGLRYYKNACRGLTKLPTEDNKDFEKCYFIMRQLEKYFKKACLFCMLLLKRWSSRRRRCVDETKDCTEICNMRRLKPVFAKKKNVRTSIFVSFLKFNAFPLCSKDA